MNERVMPDTGYLMADEVLFTIHYCQIYLAFTLSEWPILIFSLSNL